ncbi:MAG TPA: glycoside hydrolase family 3 C-terminal domain-containing protein, partial [Cyclobacteriaceae bacterium]|nr:glycoside hydrolase family 3 C-terminal domain-containing protein [Cyclobacteriaceae bacterium]
GFWSMQWPDDSTRIVTQWQGIRNKVQNGTRLLYAKGCEINDSSRTGFAEALAAAQQADVVIMSMGEASNMSGEAKSRSNIHLPGVQEELIKAIHATGKPVIVLLNAGRPLVFNWTADNAGAILYTWWLGTEAGNAIADVLFGDYNPAAKLPMTFPRTVGQVPVYYNYYNTGRPASGENEVNYVSAYIDLPNSPKFPFGFGLSYTTFGYGPVQLSNASMKGNGNLTASVQLTNTGKFAGHEVVQLYIRDVTGSVVRPVKELKGFKKVFLQPGESTTVSFVITTYDLKFYNKDMVYDWEAGEFVIMIGGNSRDVQSAKVNWMK